jgi:4-diphosphocytidyl-2-C-methyl-D-erythritol kinase
MLVYPNAKINIGLWVQEKRKDGFHEIESLFYPIPWCDILEVNKASELQMKFSGLKIPGGKDDNLIKKAFDLFKAETNIPGAYIHLHKQIPMGAGLGGGSADAAFTLKALNIVYETNLSTTALFSMSMKLGSDCGFFIKNEPSMVKGRGENILPSHIKLKGKWIALINPGIHIGTAEAYQMIQPLKRDNFRDILTKDWTELKNDFEAPMAKKHPEINKLIKTFQSADAEYVSMTGSGSTVYGIFKSKPNIEGEVFQLD